MLASDFSFPQGFETTFLMLLRWIHFVAGITWLGLLYFFTLVNVPFMKKADAATKAKVLPDLILPALHWFRWSSVVTVLVGLAYWGSTVAGAANNAGAAPVRPLVSFLAIWTVTWAIMYALLLIPGSGMAHVGAEPALSDRPQGESRMGALIRPTADGEDGVPSRQLPTWRRLFDNGWFLALLYALIVAYSAHLFLHVNSEAWEGNNVLAIGIGGGIGWMMMFNVWGIIWRIQKRLIAWTKANAENGAPIPAQSVRMARIALLASRTNFFLSFPMLFLMGAASHYPVFGR